MPKTQRDYPHCIKCQIPLENPIMRRCETEVWYMEFALCHDCTKLMLKMNQPSVTMQIDGETLKTLLKSKSGWTLQATVFVE